MFYEEYTFVIKQIYIGYLHNYGNKIHFQIIISTI